MPDAESLDHAVRDLIASSDTAGAATRVLRDLGPELYGFLRGALGSDADADDVFALTSERMWRSLESFRWSCSLRTRLYVVARNEIARFAQGARRRHRVHVTPSALDEVAAAVRTETRSALRTERRSKLQALRDELPVEDRTLLILRVDRNLPWDDIARAFLADDREPVDEEVKREAARLRKRFQVVKERLARRAREDGLLS